MMVRTANSEIITAGIRINNNPLILFTSNKPLKMDKLRIANEDIVNKISPEAVGIMDKIIAN